MAKVETIIDPRRKYSLVDIVTEGLMPWARNSRTVRKIIEADRKGHKLLKAKVEGRGGQRRYFVMGEDLIAYITIAGPYLIGSVRKTKNHVRRIEKKGGKASGGDSRKKAGSQKHIRGTQRLSGRAEANGKVGAR